MVPDAVDPNALQRGAIDGLIESLGDPHTVYISPEDFAVGIDIISGAFEGIGAQVDQDPVTGEIVIVAPFRDSPAEKAGILPGDVLVSVNGESAEGWSVADAVKKIRGPQGTDVTLVVRHEDGVEEEVIIERATIEIPTVFADNVTDQEGNAVDNLAYLEIQQFTEQTPGDLSSELGRIVDAGYEGLILDLRRNPGGGLDATVDVADMFLDDGVIITQVDRDGRETVYEANPGHEAGDLPIVMLVGPGFRERVRGAGRGAPRPRTRDTDWREDVRQGLGKPHPPALERRRALRDYRSLADAQRRADRGRWPGAGRARWR